MKESLAQNGFAIVPNVFNAAEINDIRTQLQRALQSDDDSTMKSQAGTIYGARNVLRLWPELVHLFRQSALCKICNDILGSTFGLVRTLYFDKPPDRSWALPWHKDLTIAVKDNKLPGKSFSKPTTKAGVPHLEAPEAVLQSMLTLRIHLDPVTEENGPLKVIPGSHHSGKKMHFGDAAPCSILVNEGDVLLMRPLVIHCSGNSTSTTMHRRILHLECASSSELPEGFAWHDFIAGRDP